MQTPYQSQPNGSAQGQTPKLLNAAYFAAAILMFVFIVINLALQRWIDYCFWYFGLIAVDNWSDYNHFDDEDNIDDAHDDACDSNYKDWSQDVCPHLCRNLRNLEDAGQAMLAFGILSLFALVLVAMFHVVLICKKELKILKLIYLFDVLPAFLFVLGMIIYGSINDFGSYKDTKSKYAFAGYDDPDDLTYEAGFGFAVANCIFFPIFSAFGVLVSYKTLSS